MSSIAVLLARAAAELAAHGVEDPRREARLLLEMASGLSRTDMVAEPEQAIEADQEERFRRLVAERSARTPFAYISGMREFYGLPLDVGPGVLVPRPETELIVDIALGHLTDRQAPLRILDLGVGSGCLLLTLLHQFPNARGLGVDVSETALAWAGRNAAALKLTDRAELRLGHWCREIVGTHDLVVANPPYIPAADIAGLEPEVARHEPRLALDGGPDGLDAYRAITADLGRVLARDGLALLEIGIGQANALDDLLSGAGFSVHRHHDLAGIERVLEVRHA